jgi:hypothetical protein
VYLILIAAADFGVCLFVASLLCEACDLKVGFEVSDLESQDAIHRLCQTGRHFEEVMAPSRMLLWCGVPHCMQCPIFLKLLALTSIILNLTCEKTYLAAEWVGFVYPVRLIHLSIYAENM